MSIMYKRKVMSELFFSTKNGQAELQLFYQLGNREAAHLPFRPAPQWPQHVPPPRHRHKSQRRILKDRQRASASQARKRAEASSYVSSTSNSSCTTSTTTTVSVAVSSLHHILLYQCSCIQLHPLSNNQPLRHSKPAYCCTSRLSDVSIFPGCDQPRQLLHQHPGQVFHHLVLRSAHLIPCCYQHQ